MANKKYNLRIDDFDAVIKSFTDSAGGLEFSKEEKENQILYRFTKKGEKRFCSILTCYISEGQVSFQSSGKEKELAEQCKQELVKKTELKIGESKTFTVKPVTFEDVETALRFLSEECECSIQASESLNETINTTAKITGKHGDPIYLTHYKNGTLLVQGRPGVTFQCFIEIATELFNPVDVKREHLKMFEVSEEDDIINSNLSAHLPNAYAFIGEKLDAIMAPSLILLNHPLELTDYSAYAFPALRGTEGVLKMIFNNEGISITNDFRDFFKIERGQCEWAKDCSALFPQEAVRDSLLNLYSFYHAERHTIFHVDATILSSRTLEYYDALRIVNKALILIDDVYKHR